MRRNSFGMVLVCALVAGMAVACGGNTEEPNTPAAKAGGKDLSPMDELKNIPQELDAEVAAVTKPIDDVQSVIDEIGALPKKHGLNASEVMGMAKATFTNGSVEVKLSADAPAAAKADVEAALNKLSATVKALKSTPEKVAALTTKTASLTAKVPVLATKVTSTATVTASNPFASGDAKAKAQADIQGVQKVQADVSKSISDVQSKLSGIPAMATSALAKLSASFAT